MLEENAAISVVRQVKTGAQWLHAFVCDSIVDHCIISNRTSELSYVFPLYIYPDDHKDDIFTSSEREYNIAPDLLDVFSSQWSQFQPEQLFYYVYAILHSNQYRQRFAQYLRMDFPRVPITEDYEFFSKLAEIGKELADIHLLKSPRLSPPLARYQGNGSNDTVEFIKYDEHKGIVQINPDKYFEGITPELWNYHIGGYQVLHKYLIDRKGKSIADPIHYCRMVTALALTIGIQARIDRIIGIVIQ